MRTIQKCGKIKCIANFYEFQKDVNCIQAWCLNNRFSFNSEKCIVMSYTRGMMNIALYYEIKSKYKKSYITKDLGEIS